MKRKRAQEKNTLAKKKPAGTGVPVKARRYRTRYRSGATSVTRPHSEGRKKLKKTDDDNGQTQAMMKRESRNVAVRKSLYAQRIPEDAQIRTVKSINHLGRRSGRQEEGNKQGEGLSILRN